MAIINKINEKAGLVVGVVVVGLVLFILGGDIMSANSIFNFGKDNVGKIAGERISRQQYQDVLAQQELEYQIQTDKSVGENERAGLEYQAWNELINRFGYKSEYEKLGLAVTDEEQVDMVQGKFIHQFIKGAFGGGENFNKETVIGFLNNLDQMDQTVKNKWAVIESKLPSIRLKEKYVNLLKKSEYITKEEAKNIYHEQIDKADFKYVFVPFTTIPDSTVKVNDDQLEEYLSKNKDKYKVEAGRSLDYVIFNFVPSAEDSAAIRSEMKELAKAFTETDKDTVFISGNSDSPKPPAYIGYGELNQDLRDVASLQIDSTYGPFVSNGKYAIYKVIGSKTDTLYSLKASHILFRIDTDKEGAKKQANEVLAKIKAGASFEEMALQYGTDGTKDRGGDLGWFSNSGQMVKPFEDACFKFNGKGLLPNLVETQFGYHIIKITEPKNNKKFLIGSVEKDITALDATKDAIYNKASAFASEAKDTATFKEAAKKDPSALKYSFPNVGKNDRTITSVNNAREIVRWAYNDASVGDVSQVFTLDNQYVVAILTGKRDEGTATVNDVRNEITDKVRNEIKGDQIIEKLSKISGDFSKIASTYGTQAISADANEITFASTSIGSIGYDPISSGKGFGLKAGKKTEPFKGENGVAILQLVKVNPAPEIADYNQYKTQKEQQRVGSTDYFIDEAIKKLADVEDERYKFF